MFRTFKPALLAGASAALWAMPAMADDALPNSPDDITVTARRRAELAQDVPLALSVVSADLLNATRSVNLQQVSTLVPSLNYSSANPRNTAFTIRGLGSSVVSVSQANDGLEPGVGFYVDEVYHARPATAAFDFTDIDHIEVLRGPQGTVFGKNTTAGAISIITKKPSFTFGAEAEASYGQQNFRQLKGAITGPLVADLAAFRVSGSLTKRDGVIWNQRYGTWQNAIDNAALRGQILLTPASNLSIRLIGDWASFKGECCTQVYVRVAPTLKPAAQQYAALAAGLGYSVPSTNPYARVTDIDAGVGVNTQEGGASAIAELKSGPFAITSVTAWRFWDWDAANDRDYTGVPVQITQHIPSRQDQVSQEIRFSNADPGKIDYVGGLYYFHQKIVGHPISIYGAQAAYWLLPAGRPSNLLEGYGQDGTTDFHSDSLAVFGEATWHITPRLALTGGLRETWETKHGTYNTNVSGGLATTTASLITDKNSILRAQYCTASVSEEGLSGRINLAWKATRNLQIYINGASGQKSGGINMSGLPVYPAGVSGHGSGDPILSTAVIRPERNFTWEAGIKSQWLGGRATLNLAAYSTVVHDFQANVVDNAAVVALRSYLANIPRVTVRGVEADANLQVAPWFTLRGSLAYADGRYASYPAGPCPIELTGSATASCDLTGKSLPGLPKWTGSLGGEVTHDLGASQLYARADATFRSMVYGEATDSAYTTIAGYTLVNASAGVRINPRLSIEVFARNLTKANYLQNVTVQAGNSGLIVGTPSDPRMFGVTLRAKA
ncbi:TonB-dependent receptor [Novosphingobium sediminicola]|uniref:Iron complex outermembrane receptor protein n=1 Tax=Novosphingobium sediminicola TaxID=563162 RepID=A0A7W6CFS8_9SPHN|nr:TonB-dependent receptor [Novosphingobium sediminicola]MBB3955724.1 iron complex outermembrane receptor protein [Novosphingobium sediminicola]